MTLFAAIAECMAIADPAVKAQQVTALYHHFCDYTLLHDEPVQPIGLPGRPEKPQLVMPRELRTRALTSARGRAILAHAICHIEFNAINLALDAAYRFRHMPDDYYRDWLQVAADEARHFGWLSERLAQMGYAYGDFPAHNGLWEMVEKTAHDVLVRMALVPRVLEARGLDVTPGMIDKLTAAGDEATVGILQNILREEIPHVAIGTRWYRYCCAQRALDADTLFPKLLQQYMHTVPAGPMNIEARQAAGFSEQELSLLQALA